MNVLFVHNHMDGHYRHVAGALAADPGNRVVFATKHPAPPPPGVAVRTYEPHRAPDPATHPYVATFENAVLHGQAAYRLCAALRRSGFVPDVICAHAGFGPGLYLKDAFPESRLLSYFEWFYRARGSDADYLDGPLPPDAECRVRSLNAGLLMELEACDRGVCPTGFQLSRFPEPFRPKLTRLHDGVDTGLFAPAPGTPMVLPGLDLSGAAEIVTYATRGMEPYRGFPQFMRAAALLLERRPGLHVVVGGEDAVSYSARHPEGIGYKEAMLRELAGRDLSRLHFVGLLDTPDWRRLLLATSVHVYLTVPFVLSWSLIEAMAAGAAIVASDTEPVREVIDDGVEGLLADFRSPDAIADRIAHALDRADLRRSLGEAARRRALADYSLTDLLPRHTALIRALA